MKILVFASVLALCVTAGLAIEAAGTVPSCQQTPAVEGRCLALYHRYSYHPDTNECRQFVYGGCDGNSNNFVTLAACEAACKPNA